MAPTDQPGSFPAEGYLSIFLGNFAPLPEKHACFPCSVEHEPRAQSTNVPPGRQERKVSPARHCLLRSQRFDRDPAAFYRLNSQIMSVEEPHTDKRSCFSSVRLYAPRVTVPDNCRYVDIE